MTNMIIYKFTFPNNKVYIGQTINWDKRLACYRYDVKRQHFKSSLVNRAISKYGWESLEIEFIDSADNIHDLNYKESYWISFYESTNKTKGYNIRDGGENTKLSKSTKRKLSKLAKERWQSLEEKEREKRIKKNIETLKNIHNRPIPQSQRDIISKRMKKENPSHGGLSDSHVEKIKQTRIQIRNKIYEVTDPLGNKHILTHLSDFCRENNLSTSCMSRVARGVQNRTQHKGYKVNILDINTPETDQL